MPHGNALRLATALAGSPFDALLKHHLNSYLHMNDRTEIATKCFRAKPFFVISVVIKCAGTMLALEIKRAVTVLMPAHLHVQLKIALWLQLARSQLAK